MTSTQIEVYFLPGEGWNVYAIGDGSAFFETKEEALQYLKELMEFREKAAKAKP